MITRKALVYMKSMELKFRLNNEAVNFKVFSCIKQPQDMSVVSTIGTTEEWLV